MTSKDETEEAQQMTAQDRAAGSAALSLVERLKVLTTCPALRGCFG